MNQFSLEGIGTVWWIEIFDELDESALTMLKEHSERFIHQYDEHYSRFKEHSQLSILNRERVLKQPSEECRALLSYGQALYARSHGAFNILTGHILEARGYDADYSFKPKETIPFSICNPLQDLKITDEEIRISCGNVDIGGYGKGHLIDLLAEEFLKQNVQFFLINGGGDMYATSNQGRPIEVYLEHPIEKNKYLMATTLFHQGFAASSPFLRQWHHEGTTYTHIVSDAAVPELATFVKAPSATDADAFATSCLLLSEQQLMAVQHQEGFDFARFNPATNEFWQSSGFSKELTA